MSECDANRRHGRHGSNDFGKARCESSVVAGDPPREHLRDIRRDILHSCLEGDKVVRFSSADPLALVANKRETVGDDSIGDFG